MPFASMRLKIVVACLVLSVGCGDAITEHPGLPLVVVLTAPATVSSNSSVALSMTLLNASDSTLRFVLAANGGLAFDPIVRDATGQERWNRLTGLLIAADPEDIMLAPREQRVFAATWDTRDLNGALLPPGAYVIQGRLFGDGNRVLAVTAPQQISITQ